MSIINQFPVIKEPILVYEDEGLIAFAKPPGMHSVPGRASLNDPTLAAFALSVRPELSLVSGRKPLEYGLLHRLDFNTSGLLLFAKTQSCFVSMLELMESGGILKTYQAICTPSGAALPGADPSFCPEIVNLSDGFACGPVTIKSLFRNYGKGAKRVAPVVSSEGLRRKRVTDSVYSTKAVRIASEGEYELFTVEIRNGFRHQIRSHLAWCCRPVLGDPVYGGREGERLYLHAEKLGFIHPENGKTISISWPNS